MLKTQPALKDYARERLQNSKHTSRTGFANGLQASTEHDYRYGLVWSPSVGELLLGFLFAAQVLVLDVARPLRQLRALVGGVAGEQQQVARLHLPREPHEHGAVQAQRGGHLAADHLGRLVGDVGDGRQRDAPVGHRAPEVGAHQVLPKLL